MPENELQLRTRIAAECVMGLGVHRERYEFAATHGSMPKRILVSKQFHDLLCRIVSDMKWIPIRFMGMEMEVDYELKGLEFRLESSPKSYFAGCEMVREEGLD